jgi:diguanylate cyclase (GGDEF)-like protein
LSPDGSLLASVKLGERIVRVESLRAGAWDLAYRLLGGAHELRAWIACDAQDRCWRHDDGTLLLKQDPQGSLSPFPPANSREPQAELESPPERVEIVDGEVASFALKVRNVGPGPIFWIGIRRTAQVSDDGLIFHPPPIVARLEPGAETELQCRVSMHTAYENPQSQAASLELEVFSAAGRLGAFAPIEVSAPTASLAWDSVKLLQNRSLELTVRNVGDQRLSRTRIVAQLPGMSAVSEPVPSIDVGGRASLSMGIPEEVNLGSGVDLRLIAESERPYHRWTSEPRRVGGWLWRWRWVLLAGLLVAVLLAIGMHYYDARPKPQEEKAPPISIDLSNDLNELSSLLQTSEDREEAYRIIEKTTLGKLFPGMKGALLVLDNERLRVAHEWAGSRHEDRKFKRNDCYALRNDQGIHVVDGDEELVCQHLDKRSSSYLCVALKAHGKTYGVLHLMNRVPELKIPRTSRELALAIARQVAVALARIGEIERLYRDELTGLLDRRSWGEQLERKLEGFTVNQRPFGVMFTDIDHFGMFNKVYGHDAGDQVLRDIGELLLSQLRRSVDIVCRYGGEEFLVIMPNASLEVTTRRAGELKDSIKRLRSKTTDEEELGPISMSFGVAAFPEHGTSWDEVRKAAEGVMRQAKEDGRDRVVVASVPSAKAAVIERDSEDSQ